MWNCSHCTFSNKFTSDVCEACHNARDNVAGANFDTPTGTQLSGLPVNRKPPQRQTSLTVESRRKRDEMHAKDQWQRIVNYCKMVWYFCNLSNDDTFLFIDYESNV